MNPKEIRGLRCVDNIEEGEIFEDEISIMANFNEGVVWRCDECEEDYDDKLDAEECCEEEEDETG